MRVIIGIKLFIIDRIYLYYIISDIHFNFSFYVTSDFPEFINDKNHNNWYISLLVYSFNFNTNISRYNEEIKPNSNRNSFHI